MAPLPAHTDACQHRTIVWPELSRTILTSSDILQQKRGRALKPTATQPKKTNGRRRKCAYCKGAYESSDHSPPKSLLIWPPSPGAKVLTIPSCFRCNQSTSKYENLVWIVLALVGRHPILADYCSPGGKVDRAFAQDPSLQGVVEGCKNSEGYFTFTGEIYTAFDRVLRKTAQGLYYGLYGRVPALEKFKLLSIEHSHYRLPEEVISRLRKPAFRDITDEPLPTLTDRGLQNVYVLQAVLTDPVSGEEHTISGNVFRDTGQEDVEWTVYQEGTLRFTFFQHEDGDAICVMDLWGTLISAVKAPWPNQRGVLRKGRKNPNARQ